MTDHEIKTQCCIAGGGPAGMMLGLLLARAGVNVAVLEKHGDFLRDFRGDTLHPSTLEVMAELGLLDELLRRPHQQAREIHAIVGDEEVAVADFTHLPTRCGFIAFMPQWDFLDFLAEAAARYKSFRLILNAEVNGLLRDPQQRVVGVRASTPDGSLEVRAELTVAADGRHSTVRQLVGLTASQLGAPMDVLWMRLSMRPGDPEQTTGQFEQGRILAMIRRDDYWQCGFVIPKGGYDDIRRQGLAALRAAIVDVMPRFADRVDELADWNDVRLLTVAVDRLTNWTAPGLLCIGDAAHAMSPVGGVGINLAIQDAVAAANLLAEPLWTDTLCDADVKRVQRRRELPTRLTQRAQVFVQNRIIRSVLAGKRRLATPLPLRLLKRFPVLRRIPGRLVGIGLRPEHVQTREFIGHGPAAD